MLRLGVVLATLSRLMEPLRLNECDVEPSPDDHLMISEWCKFWTESVSQTSSHSLHELRDEPTQPPVSIVVHATFHLLVCL
jgi:hypothetical protein